MQHRNSQMQQSLLSNRAQECLVHDTKHGNHILVLVLIDELTENPNVV
jgi:hypothetical protein